MKRLMPTAWLLIAIVLCVALHFLLPIRFVVPVPWNVLGLIPLLVGVWVNLAADRELKKASTTVKPFEESAALVQTGVYHRTRNPMYVGFVAIVLGIAVMLRSLSPYAVVVALAVVLDVVYIRIEEDMLADRFGDQWRLYRATVRRWV